MLRPTACVNLLYVFRAQTGPTQHKLNNSSLHTLRWIIHWGKLCVTVQHTVCTGYWTWQRPPFFTLSLFIFPYLVYFFSWANPPAMNKKRNEENTIMSSTHFPDTSFFNFEVSPFRHFAPWCDSSMLISALLSVPEWTQFTCSLSFSFCLPPSWNLLHYSNVLQTFIHECTESTERERRRKTE